MMITNIPKSTKIGENVKIHSSVILGENIEIGNDVFIDVGVIVRDNVKIGNGSFIGARCILGEYTLDFINNRKDYTNPSLVIGNNALIRSEAIIYAGSSFGDNMQTGHRVTIREKTIAGKNFRVGTLSDVQGDCEIGDYVNFHSNVHIGQKSKIGNYVWIFPYVVLTNDPTPPSENLLGVIIESFAVIATMSVILPGVKIKTGALVGAGSIVSKDVDADMVVVGNPAKVFGNTSKIKNKITGDSVYPWQYFFDRGMPWLGIGYEEWSKQV